MPPRRTKIVATLGPASTSPEICKKMLEAGVDLVRLNLSHAHASDYQPLVTQIRDLAAELKKEIGIIADLQGPKIRIAKFRDAKVTLHAGQTFDLDASLPEKAGDESQVGIDYKDLPSDVAAGDCLLLDDGRIELDVVQVQGARIHCVVKTGGILSNHKGINRLGGGLSASALTEKDKADIKSIADLAMDYVAVSFPRGASDMLDARALLSKAGSKAGLIAKIERREALENLDDLIQASDAVMVARGDLGVEMGYAALPAIQKKIIHRARALDKAVITATQMMESMIHQQIPTRAEVSDVANAVLDGTDAVMLSAETAVGAYPDKVVAVMASICLNAESYRMSTPPHHRMHKPFTRVDEAIAMATMYTANHLDIKAIVALTESGSTPLWMSRIRSGIPIYGLSRHVLTRRRMTLFRGVYPVAFDVTQVAPQKVRAEAIKTLVRQGIVKTGDLVIMTQGDALGVHGHANVLKIVRVGEEE